MRASTLGCIIASPWPSGISRSAKARLRCSAGTKSSRLTSKSRSSTSVSSTSQGRICCSIMLKRACSMFMALAAVGRESIRGARGRRIVANETPANASVEGALVALQGRRRHHQQDQRERPDVLGDVGDPASLEEDGAYNAQEVRERE